MPRPQQVHFARELKIVAHNADRTEDRYFKSYRSTLVFPSSAIKCGYSDTVLFNKTKIGMTLLSVLEA